ncbi:hypothetical protein Bca52824_074050 [Brassica carinata]|uniref:Uncharacterized protein n=1 Tax=Brassica carinata TaxID=52824 RepID=A0A8X7U7B5_BRACI|nr:hypothetical protein Bca52824_074050 [Brassica carinata]
MATSYTLLADLRVGRCSNTATPPRKQAVLRDGIQVATDEVKGLRSIKVCVQARHYLLQTVSGEEQAVYPGASYC